MRVLVWHEDRRRPRGVLYTGHASAQRFSNEICNLTVDTGVDNPGACGIEFIANNQGGVYNVTIQSGDGQGVKGLDLGYTDEQGPCLIKNVRVIGFDYGVYVATSVASETLEHIIFEHQNVAGFRNDGQPCTVRDLRSLNAVPAFRADSGSSFLIDCAFVGKGKAKLQPALIVQSNAMVCNLHTEGYRVAIELPAADAYHSTGTGDIYIEDVVGRYFLFHHQHLWARQFNPEGDGTHVLNDGGTAWILGLKTEGGGTLLETTNNGRSELLGSFSYSVGNTKLAPIVV